VNAIRYIFTNPLGWAIVFVHWIVIAFAYLGDRPSDSFGVHAGATDLMFYLALLDSPSLLLSTFLTNLFNRSTTIALPWLIPLVTLITLQWLLVGAGISKLYCGFRQEVPVDGCNGPKLL